MTSFFHEWQLMFQQGGLGMWGLVVLSSLLYGSLILIMTRLWRLSPWRRGILDPETQSELVDAHDANAVVHVFAKLELGPLAQIQRHLPYAAILTGLAPLIGLLGTVSGMLTTFAGLANSSAAQPIEKISAGVSEALITTQAGLTIAIPAAIITALLQSQLRATEGSLQKLLHQSLTRLHPVAPTSLTD